MTEQDRRAVGGIVEALEKAWNAGDGAAYAAQFTDDADFVNIFGLHAKGRQAITDGHHRIFTTVYKGSVNRLAVTQARMLAPDVALVHMRASLEVPSGPMAGTIEALPSGVCVRDGGAWKIAAFHNTRIQELPFAPNQALPR